MTEKKEEHPVIKWAREIANKIISDAEEYSKKYLSDDYINKVYEEILSQEEAKLKKEIEETMKFFDERIKRIKSIPREELEKIAEEITEEVVKP